MEKEIEISFEDWEEKYQPLKHNTGGTEDELIDFHPNVVNKEEKQILEKALRENRVWTLIAGDIDMEIVSGNHWVNRMDTYITKIPYNKNEIITVKY